MNGSQIAFLAVVFFAVAIPALAAMLALSPVPLRDRLRAFRGKDSAARVDEGGGWVERVARVARPFTRLSLPEEGWERSPLRTRFMNAGWRSANAPVLYFAAKTVLAIGLPLVLAIVLAGSQSAGLRKIFLLLLCSTAAIGYYLPNMILARTAERRQREIFENLPDALDLLTICVEAGLSLERALSKVASEMHVKSVVLAQELQLVLMELRAGFSKDKALRNFALRSGVEDVDTLVAMLIQSERFGTSMGDSLRVHSENLRLKRSLMAEEAAARIALKLLFPLIFCIFPALMLVLLGPAAIQITRVLLPSLTGGH
ncbi:type II secretion system F family protein [Massilia endophytica]|uniref:type II secretion system F family protein n=1 Tax=Massilia endophytica TaxID=2899220 RepID=UPI001E5E2F95|nr:type II secretion system F family protein [Massilia endophytica]UGQ46172.1 type II secretion system F family protein [Massilia endophytica]